MSEVVELLQQELKDIPKYPWSLKLNKKTKNTELLDAEGKVMATFKRSPMSLILANFVCYAPTRFETLIDLYTRTK